MATFVLVHASFKGGWSWKRVTPLLRAEGHEVYTPTLTGLGERSHLATSEINLDTHIQDVVNLLFYEDLTDVILVGHSYAGMVITGAAARAAGRIARLIYLDAYLPEHGQCEYDLWPPSDREVALAALAAGESFRQPPPVELLDIGDPQLAAWLAPRMVAQPVATYTQPLAFGSAWDPHPPRAYILCTEGFLAGQMAVFANRARAAGWPVRELPAVHDVMVTAPAMLAAALDELAQAFSRPEE